MCRVFLATYRDVFKIKLKIEQDVESSEQHQVVQWEPISATFILQQSL